MAEDHFPKRIMPQAVFNKMNTGEEFLLLDYRTKAGVNADNRKLPGATWVKDGTDINRALQNTSKDRLIITYCT